MQCKCGGEITTSTHEVKTHAKACEWARETIAPKELPVTIEHNKCKCGRSSYTVTGSQSFCRSFG